MKQKTTVEEFVATIPMPFQGESIVDGVLLNWHVKPGDTVKTGDPLAEIETEKSAWTLESPCNGEIISLEAQENDVVDVSAPLLRIRTRDENMMHLREQGSGGPAADTALAQRTAAAPPVPDTDAPPATPGNGHGTGGASTAPAAAPHRQEAEDQRLSPFIKGLLREGTLDLQELALIQGSGRGGRITASDVRSHLASRPAPAAAPAAAAGAHGTAAATGSVACGMTGLGVAVPDRIVSNTAFKESFPDLSAEYIKQVTGIVERHYVAEGENTSDLAVAAARRALQAARIEPQAVDMIILATTTPDMPLPATACEVQARLGCGSIPAFDLSAACSGWLYGINVATQFVATGTYRNVLVIAAESMSRLTNPADRATAFLFGDGAGAAVIAADPGALPGAPAGGAGDQGGTDRRSLHRISNIVMKSDPSGYDIIYRKAGGSRLPYQEMSDPADAYWFMDGKRMYQGAVRLFAQIIQEVLQSARLSIDEVQWVVPHQANQRMWKSVARLVGTSPEKFFSNIAAYGNTSAATIPLALNDLRHSDAVRPGDKLIFCAVGAGLTYAGCLVTW